MEYAESYLANSFLLRGRNRASRGVDYAAMYKYYFEDFRTFPSAEAAWRLARLGYVVTSWYELRNHGDMYREAAALVEGLSTEQFEYLLTVADTIDFMPLPAALTTRTYNRRTGSFTESYELSPIIRQLVALARQQAPVTGLSAELSDLVGHPSLPPDVKLQLLRYSQSDTARYDVLRQLSVQYLQRDLLPAAASDYSQYEYLLLASRLLEAQPAGLTVETLGALFNSPRLADFFARSTPAEQQYLFEVVAQDLVKLRQVGAEFLEPPRKTLVQVRAG